MQDFQNHIKAYQSALQKGDILKAYKGIIEFISKFRTILQHEYPEYNVPNTMYEGVMDITYFAFSPQVLKANKLKLAVVFHHETLSFETWLVGQNKAIQKKYWIIFKDSDWAIYPITPSPEHAIIRHAIIHQTDFSNPTDLRAKLEEEVVQFTNTIVELFNVDGV